MLRRLPAQRCQARTHGGYPCGKYAVRGKRVCRWHGGMSPGRQGPRDAEHMRKLREGSQRWYAERRARKAAGLPVPRMGRIPGRRPSEPIEISRVRRDVKEQMAATVKEGGEIVDLMERLRLKALQTLQHVLDLPNSLDEFGGDHLMHDRRLRLQANAARSFVANAIKVDATRFRAQHEGWLEAFNKKLAEAEAKLKTRQERISKG
jgi:hypothetical protein